MARDHFEAFSRCVKTAKTSPTGRLIVTVNAAVLISAAAYRKVEDATTSSAALASDAHSEQPRMRVATGEQVHNRVMLDDRRLAGRT